MGGSSSAHARGIHEEEPQEDTASGLTFLTPEKREKEKNNEDELGEQHEKSQGIEGEGSRGALTIQEDDGAAEELETEGRAGRNGKVGEGSRGALTIQEDDGAAEELETEGRAGRNGKVYNRLKLNSAHYTSSDAHHTQVKPARIFGIEGGRRTQKKKKKKNVQVKWTCYWKDVWRIALYSLWIHGTLGCDVGKVMDCPEFSNFGRSPIPYGGSVEVGTIPDKDQRQYSLKIDIFQASEKFDCRNTITNASPHNCSVLLWDRPVTACPGFSLEHIGNESVIKYTNVTENLEYCTYVEGPNYHHVHQGGVFIDDIPSAPTCRALRTAAFVSQSGCEQDPPGHVKRGSVCQFSCPDGYIGHGDENKTCMADGTWSSTNFTCEVVTCPAPNVTGPLQMKVGSICSFPCPSGSQEGAVLKVCLLNGTWITTDSSCPAASLNNDNNTGYIVAVSILAIIVGFTIIGCCCSKYRKYKKRQQSKKSGLPRVHFKNGVNGTLHVNGNITNTTQIGE